jgi:hypothetical protein
MCQLIQGDGRVKIPVHMLLCGLDGGCHALRAEPWTPAGRPDPDPLNPKQVRVECLGVPGMFERAAPGLHQTFLVFVSCSERRLEHYTKSALRKAAAAVQACCFPRGSLVRWAATLSCLMV